MSITGIINNKDIPEIAEFLNDSMPDRSEFKSYRYNRAFLTSREVIAPYKLPSPSYASMVGTSFDYYARFVIARKLKNEINKKESLKIVARYGIEYLKYIGLQREAVYAKQKYEKHMENIEDYISGYDMPESWIREACCFFSVLEHFVRCGKVYRENLYLTMDDSVDHDLMHLIDGFKINFLDRYVKENSNVIFNPTFRCFDGADADIFIDGALYDFKTSKSLGYKASEEAQIWAYFLLHEIDKNNIEIDTFSRAEITRIGIYKARCADVDYVDIDKEKHNVSSNAKKLEELLKTYKLYKGYDYKKDELH